MAAYKKKVKAGERWYARSQYLGQSYCSPAIFLTKAQALKWEREKRAEIEAYRISNDIPLRDVLKARLDYLKLTKNKHYFEDNRRHANLMLESWNYPNASEVTKKMVSDLLLRELERCRKEGFTNHRPNALYTNIRSFFNYGIKKLDLDIKNPCYGLEKFSIDYKVKFIPTDEMINDVMAICTPEQRALIRFCSETACRINEALNFTVNDILVDGIVLYTRKSRHSNLMPRILSKPSLPEIPKTGRIFHQWNKRPVFLDEKIIKLKQPKWGWHGLRHHRTHKWALYGEPTVSIMAKLGHSSIDTTMVYLRSLAINRF